MSVESQEEEGRERADELGVKVVDVYNDNNLSGSEYRQKERKNWPRMLADITSGKLRVIIMWDTSRGSRDLEDWVRFLKLIAEHGVLVHAVSHDRTYNPNNHRDWQVLAEDGVKNAAFSKQLSANVKRGWKRAARAGRPRGTARFGWQRVYDEKSGKMLTQIPHSGERPFVEEAYRRVIAGESILDVAKDWARRCRLPEGHDDRVPMTRKHTAWSYINVREMLLSPVHMGKFKDPKTGKLLDGNWDGFIEEGEWLRAKQIIVSTAHPTGSRPGGAKYLLTFIARCGVCGSWMGWGRARKRITLTCVGLNEDRSPMPSKGHTSTVMEWVDEIVLNELAWRLTDRQLVADVTRHDDAQQLAARAEATRLKLDLEEAWAKVMAREPGYTHDRVAQMEAAWLPEIERLSEVADEGLSAGAALALEVQEIIEGSGVTGDELQQIVLRAVKNRIALPGQRELVRTFCPSIRIMPAKRRGETTFDPGRVEIL